MAAALLPASADKPSFQTAKTQAVGLHRSLISAASPSVRAKITASAQAAREYLAKCGRACDLQAFLAKDLRGRFTVKKDLDLQVLQALAFGEAFSDISQADQLKLQNEMEKQTQMIQLMSNISKTTHDTLKGIIQNLR
jgi:hypothetical protein